MTPTPRRGETRPPERVLLLSESTGLAAILGGLLAGADRLVQVGSLRDAADRGGLAGADAVVLDTPADARPTTLEHLRRDYRGPLVVLVEPGTDASDLRRDDATTLLARPFAAEDLGVVLGLPPLAAQPGRGRPLPAAAPEGRTEPAPPDRSGWSRIRHRVEVLPAELVHAWRARRWVRMAAFWAVCVLAFVTAFVLAARDNSLGAVDVTPLPTVEVDPPAAPTTTGRLPASTAVRERTPGAGGFRGTVVASTTTAARATTTTRPAPAGGGTTRPPTTRPPTTTNGATTTTNRATTTTVTTVAGP